MWNPNAVATFTGHALMNTLVTLFFNIYFHMTFLHNPLTAMCYKP